LARGEGVGREAGAAVGEDEIRMGCAPSSLHLQRRDGEPCMVMSPRRKRSPHTMVRVGVYGIELGA